MSRVVSSWDFDTSSHVVFIKKFPDGMTAFKICIFILYVLYIYTAEAVYFQWYLAGQVLLVCHFDHA